MPGMPRGRRIRQSLLEVPRVAGVPFDLCLMELLMFVGMLGVFGLRLPMFVGIAVLMLVHVALSAATRDDALLVRLFFDSWHYQRFYPAQGLLVPRREPSRVRGALPEAV